MIQTIAKRIRGYQGICGANPNTATLFFNRIICRTFFSGVRVKTNRPLFYSTLYCRQGPESAAKWLGFSSVIKCKSSSPNKPYIFADSDIGGKKRMRGCRNSSTSTRSNDSMDFNGLLMEYQRPPQPSWVQSWKSQKHTEKIHLHLFRATNWTASGALGVATGGI